MPGMKALPLQCPYKAESYCTTTVPVIFGWIVQ
jgi:hypothetical protein